MFLPSCRCCPLLILPQKSASSPTARPKRQPSSVDVMLLVFSSSFRISDPPRCHTIYDQRRNEYQSKDRTLPPQRIAVCVAPEFLLHLVRLSPLPCDDRLIYWPCAGSVTRQGLCCGRPSSFLQPHRSSRAPVGTLPASSSRGTCDYCPTVDGIPPRSCRM